jgi:uncharacterized membrane protein YGL010W
MSSLYVIFKIISNQKFIHFIKLSSLINSEKYELKNSKNEINITYALYILISIYVFFLYLKTTSSIYMAFMLIGAAWFALIIFRTLVFIGGRV